MKPSPLEAAAIAGEKVEDAELDSYMDLDNAGDEGPSDDDRKAYLHSRYEAVKNEYKVLQLNRSEAEGSAGNPDLLSKIANAFRINYKVRKWVVKSLRELGETAEDKFIR